MIILDTDCQSIFAREKNLESILRANLAHFDSEASFGPQDSAKCQSVAKNAEFYAKTNEMNALKSTIRHLVKNYCADNPGATAAWNTAAHVESPPTKKAPIP